MLALPHTRTTHVSRMLNPITVFEIPDTEAVERKIWYFARARLTKRSRSVRVRSSKAKSDESAPVAVLALTPAEAACADRRSHDLIPLPVSRGSTASGLGRHFKSSDSHEVDPNPRLTLPDLRERVAAVWAAENGA